MQKLKDEIRNLSAQLANVEFTYRDPMRNFDRSKVKGVVAKLIKVRDGSTMTALEVRMHDTSLFISYLQFGKLTLTNLVNSQVTAGGKLFNVVVDTENTGKQLLQNGDLRRRVTIIPLNKIQSHLVPPRVQHSAVRLVSHCINFSPQSNIFVR